MRLQAELELAKIFWSEITSVELALAVRSKCGGGGVVKGKEKEKDEEEDEAGRRGRRGRGRR